MPGERGSDGPPLRAWLLCGATLAVLGWYLGFPGRALSEQGISNLLLLFTSALAAVSCLSAGRARGDAGFWTWLGWACLAWFLGQAVWTARGFAVNPAPAFPTLADVGYAAFYPLAAIAFIRSIRQAPPRLNRRSLLDGSLVAVVAGLYGVIFVLTPLGPGPQTAPLWAGATLLTQAAAVGLVGLSVLALVWAADPGRRLSLLVIVPGLAAFAAADVVYGQAGFLGALTASNLTDLGWQAGFLSLALGALLAPAADRWRKHEVWFTGDRWRLAGTALSVLAFGVLAAWAATAAASPLLPAGLLVATGLITLRTAIAVRDERLLAERTRERDRLAAELRAQQTINTELARLNQDKSDFIRVVSHEFRTPLTSVQGFAELIADEQLDPAEARDFALVIAKNARRLSRMVGDMLDLDRLEAGPAVISPELVDLNAVVTEVVAALRPAVPAHRIAVTLAPVSPLVSGNRDQLTRVVTNLLDNAIKYQPQGGRIELRTALSPGLACLTVRDSGIGIPAELLASVFDRFVRTPEASARFAGTGLGLAITKAIIEQHGGRIWAERLEPAGTAFHIELAAIAPDGAAARGGSLNGATRAAAGPPALARAVPSDAQ